MVELWMAEVASQMKDSLVFCTHQALNEWKDQPDLNYLQNYPGQCIYCASALRWTATVTEHLNNIVAGGPNPNHWLVTTFIFTQKIPSQIRETLGFGRKSRCHSEPFDEPRRILQHSQREDDVKQFDTLLHSR